MLVGCVSNPVAPIGARADPCGGVDVELDATCVLDAGEACRARCEPSSLEASCAAALFRRCRGVCLPAPTVDCQRDCQSGCRADCEMDPDGFSCTEACEVDCEEECDALCEPEDSECRAACEVTCFVDCRRACDVVQPDAPCEAKCEGVCNGLCTARSRVSCEIDCQGPRFADCRTRLQDVCETQCGEPEGALFCDGQWIDAEGGPRRCIDVLESAELEIVSPTVAVEEDAGCSTAFPRDSGPLRAGLLGSLAVVLAVAGRRRR